MADGFSIKGVMPDWGSIEMLVGPISYTPLIKDISYKDKLSRKLVYGTPRNPVGRTGGIVEPDGSMTLYRQAWQALRDKLGNGWGLVEFDIMLNFRMPGSLQPDTDMLEACSLSEADHSYSQGEDPLEVKLTLSMMRIKHNGLYMAVDEYGT
jgi:hypothetical protein